MENKYDVIIGIDIGLSGGLAFFDTEAYGKSTEDGTVDTGILSIRPMPTEPYVTKSGKDKNRINLGLLRYYLEIPKAHEDQDVLLVFEDVHAFPGQGVVATATLMEQKGIIEGMGTALGYDLLPIEPKLWQKYFGLVPSKELSGNKNKAKRKKWLKDNSILTAKEKFPNWTEKIGNSHGLSDAMLIGLYAQSLEYIPSA